MRVAVVGAGILGASVAYRLSQNGARVRLVDAEHPAPATPASFAWLNANRKTPRTYFELNRSGMEEHRRLQDELPGGASWLHPTGNLVWSAEPEGLDRRVERLRGWGYAAEWLTARRANEELEPGVAFPNPDAPVAFFPEESWVDAPLLVGCLVDPARRNGAETRFGVAVEAVETSNGRACGVRLADGGRLAADAVVNAAGAGAGRLAATVGRNLPLAPRRGLLVRVAVEGEPLGRVLHTPRVNLRPDGPGRVALHHESADERLGTEPVGVLCGNLLGRAREVVPALRGAEVLEGRVGVRPIPADGFPCVGAPGVPGYFEAVTHSGVTLGPLVGRLLAREVLEGVVDPLLAPFRPGRFGA